MKRSQFIEETYELVRVVTMILLLTLPSIIAYYFCRDYYGRGNSPENAPAAAFVVLIIWLPLYYLTRDLPESFRRRFDIISLAILLLLLIQVTFNNPKF